MIYIINKFQNLEKIKFFRVFVQIKFKFKPFLYNKSAPFKKDESKRDPVNEGQIQEGNQKEDRKSETLRADPGWLYFISQFFTDSM